MEATVIFSSSALLPIAAHAELYGLLAGREATPAKTIDLTVELGIVDGKFDNEDYQNIAARAGSR